MKVSRLISPIITVNLVTVANALEWSQKAGQISNQRSNTYGEKLMKIVPVDPQIICLKGYIFFKNEGCNTLPFLNSRVTGPKFTEFFKQCSQIITDKIVEIGLVIFHSL